MPTEAVVVPINYVAVLVAALAQMALGMMWYGPVFGKQWMAMMGFSKDSMKSMAMTPIKAMIIGFIVALIMSYVLAHSIVFASTYLQITGISAGLQGGFWNWLGFIAPVTIGAVLWEGKSWKLWFLNAAYWLVALCMMGAIIALLR